MSVSQELSAESVKRLLGDFVGRKCACILGAGVSAPMVPANLNRRGLDMVIRLTDAIEVGTQGRTPQNRSWLRSTGYEWSAFVRGAIGQLTQQAYRMLEYEITKPGPLAAAPAQYAVFRCISRSVIILTYNYDGLAKRFCPQFVVREMHGRHSPEFPFDWELAKLFPLAMRGHEIAPASLHYFEAEPPNLYGIREEHWFSQALSDCSDLVIIGYSFAQQNDQETYKRVCRYLRDKEVRVTVVGPHTEELVLRLRDSLRTNDVVGVPAYWNHLARAILKVSCGTIEGDIRGALRYPGEVYEHYINFRDGNHRDLNQVIEVLADVPRLRDSEFEAWKNYVEAHF